MKINNIDISGSVAEDLINRLKQIGMQEDIAINCIKHYVSTTKDDEPIPMGNLVYGEELQRLFYSNLKPYALEYMEENHPQAWFKPMLFDDEKQYLFMESIKTK